MRNIIILVLIAIILSLLTYTLVHAQGKEVIKILPETDLPIGVTINHYAAEYKVNPTVLKMVMKCESGGNQDAIGDNGAALGIFQYHAPTFDRFSKELGEDLNRESAQDQAKLTAYAFSKGYERHWSCWSKLYGSNKVVINVK